MFARKASTPVAVGFPVRAAVCRGSGPPPWRARRPSLGTYWLQSQGPFVDNGDMLRAVVTALEPTRTGRRR